MPSLFDWSSTAASNTTVDGTNIAEGCPAGNLNGGLRSVMALVRGTFVSGWQGLFAGTTTGIPYSNGAGTVTTLAISGIICMWSGSSGTIPTGWYLCDGTNGTPDLRNKFIVGATSTYAVGATGGSADATLVSHTHTATVTDPGHFHNLPGSTSSGGINQTQIGVNSTSINATSSSKTTGITVSNSTEGSSATNANLPPYYALCYIMKS